LLRFGGRCVHGHAQAFRGGRSRLSNAGRESRVLTCHHYVRSLIATSPQKSLDHIGRRGNVGGSIRSERINHAYDILAKETLPHISIERSGFKQKAYFFGYMVHRLVLAKLNRRELDDRDHFGKKRLDLAGPLLANLFRQLYRKFTRDIYRNLQKVGLAHVRVWYYSC